MNKVIMIGNLTKDPEMTKTASGIEICHFSIAVNRNFENSEGVREADFFNVTVWRGLASVCAKYLSKGYKVALAGAMQNNSYEDKDGIRRYYSEIIADEVDFLTGKEQSEDKKKKANEKK